MQMTEKVAQRAGRPAARALQLFLDAAGMPDPQQGEYRYGYGTIQCFLEDYGLVLSVRFGSDFVNFDNYASYITSDHVVLPLVKNVCGEGVLLVNPMVRLPRANDERSFPFRRLAAGLNREGIKGLDLYIGNIGMIEPAPGKPHYLLIDQGAGQAMRPDHPRFNDVSPTGEAPVQSEFFAPLVREAGSIWPSGADQPDHEALRRLLRVGEYHTLMKPSAPDKRLFVPWDQRLVDWLAQRGVLDEETTAAKSVKDQAGAYAARLRLAGYAP